MLCAPSEGSFLRSPCHQPSELGHSRSLTMRPNSCPFPFVSLSFQMISPSRKNGQSLVHSLERGFVSHTWDVFLIPLISSDAYAVSLWAIVCSILTIALEGWCPIIIPTSQIRKLKPREVESHAQDTQQLMAQLEFSPVILASKPVLSYPPYFTWTLLHWKSSEFVIYDKSQSIKYGRFFFLIKWALTGMPTESLDPRYL